MNIQISPFIIDHYDMVFQLWQNSPGVGLSDTDSEANIDLFLMRNPGLSMVALVNGELVGVCLAGHDGRRGYVHHLAVHGEYRRKGIGEKLVDACLEKLKEHGMSKCHLFIFHENDVGRVFWEKMGWSFRQDIGVISKHI